MSDYKPPYDEKRGLPENDTTKWLRPIRQPDGTVLWYPVTRKERLFILEYMRSMNPSKAARVAGYSGDDYKMDTMGRDVLHRPHIREIVERECFKELLQPPEILQRLREQTESNPADFFKDVLEVKGDGTVEVVGHEFDWDHFRKYGHLVKEFRIEHGKVQIKTYDAQKALELLGKHRKLWTETLQLEGDGEIIVKIVKGVSYDEL